MSHSGTVTMVVVHMCKSNCSKGQSGLYPDVGVGDLGSEASRHDEQATFDGCCHSKSNASVATGCLNEGVTRAELAL